MCCVSLFKVFHDSQRMKVVVKAQPILLQAAVQRPLTCVSERWMSDIVHQCERFGEIRVESKRCSHLSGDLGDLDRMRQPAAKMI